MQKKHLKKAAPVVLALALAGCGGGGGSSETASTPQAPLTCPAGQYLDLSTGTCVAVSTVKASSFAGNWDGTYTLSGITTGSVPVTLELSAQDSTKTVSGQVYSRYLAATMQGGVADDGTVTLTGTNSVDGKAWRIVLAKTTAGMMLTSIGSSDGASSGSGSCAAAATVAFDLVGEYPVTITQSFPGSDSTVINARMNLARVNAYSYSGAIVGDGNLKAKINFFRIGSSWAMQIPSGEYLGSSMLAVTNGLLSQSPPITDVALTTAKTDGVKSPVLSPLTVSMDGTYLMNLAGKQIEQFCTYTFKVQFE